MSKIEEKRASQREALIEAAEHTIAEQGLAALKARNLATAVGVSLGGVYNLVGDLDELILLASLRTLGRLDESLAPPAEARTPEDRLAAIALAYARFARDNLLLWRALFEHRLAPGKDLPDWQAQAQLKLFAHLAEPLRQLAPQQSEAERALLARTWFSAVHGVVLLGLEEKLVAVPQAELERQIARMVRALCAGARQG